MWDTCELMCLTCDPMCILCVVPISHETYMWQHMWDHMWYHVTPWEISSRCVCPMRYCVCMCDVMWLTCVMMWAYVAHMCHAWPTCATNFPHVGFMWASEPTWDPHDATCDVVWEHSYTCEPYVGLNVHINSHVSVSCGLIILEHIYYTFTRIYRKKTFVLFYTV